MVETRLTGASESALIQAVEDNYIALFRQMAGELGGEFEECNGFGRHISFPPHPSFKGAWRARLTDENVEAAIDETVAWFKQRNAPFFMWWTHTGTTPLDIGERLIARGIKSREMSASATNPGLPAAAQGSPVMVADMHKFDEALLARVPAGFHISRVENARDLAEFTQVVKEVYPQQPEAAEAWSQATAHAGILRAPWKLYVGWLNGKAVATNVVVEGAGIVSVWVVATREEARGQGIGAAVTLAPLLEARAAGYQYAALFASEMGVPVYERIGFYKTGTRINRFLWRSEA